MCEIINHGSEAGYGFMRDEVSGGELCGLMMLLAQDVMSVLEQNMPRQGWLGF